MPKIRRRTVLSGDVSLDLTRLINQLRRSEVNLSIIFHQNSQSVSMRWHVLNPELLYNRRYSFTAQSIYETIAKADQMVKHILQEVSITERYQFQPAHPNGRHCNDELLKKNCKPFRFRCLRRRTE